MNKYDEREIKSYVRAIHQFIYGGEDNLYTKHHPEIYSEFRSRDRVKTSNYVFARWAEEIIDGLRDENALKIIAKAVELRLSDE